MRRIIAIFALCAAAVLPAPTLADVTQTTCKADYDKMIAAAEDNRERSLVELEAELRHTGDDAIAGKLMAQIDRAWQMEEEFRSTASNIYRDCRAYVESGGS